MRMLGGGGGGRWSTRSSWSTGITSPVVGQLLFVAVPVVRLVPRLFSHCAPSSFLQTNAASIRHCCGTRIRGSPPPVGNLYYNHCRSIRSHSSTTSSTKLSRSERRALERKQRNKERRRDHEQQQQQTNHETSSFVGSVWRNGLRNMLLLPMHQQSRLMNALHPRVVGSGHRLSQDHLWYLMWRLPWACLIGYLFVDSDYTPYQIQPSLGPSMLPTIQFIGDVWLVETRIPLWWKERLRQLLLPLYRLLGDPSGTTTTTVYWQRGDVVLWKDPTTHRISCKRIVGLPGNVVLRYGEYASWYPNFGIHWPKHSSSSNSSNNTNHSVLDVTWDPEPDDIRVDRTVTVPDNHVWLEGDCPPFSLDSRHYGPISMDYLCGRLVLRLWPLTDNLYFQGLSSRSSSWLCNMKRPVPFPSADDYLGKRFNFYRIQEENDGETK